MFVEIIGVRFGWATLEGLFDGAFISGFDM